jgi:transcriptional regulator with XRE-family HTH domain
MMLVNLAALLYIPIPSIHPLTPILTCALIKSNESLRLSTSFAMRRHVREEIAATAHNQLAGSLLKQGRSDAGGGKSIKQDVYARKLAASLRLGGLSRQTLSGWERGVTVVPAAALLASAEVVGVNVGQLVESARETVRARIANLEAQLLTAAPQALGRDGHSTPMKSKVSRGNREDALKGLDS